MKYLKISNFIEKVNPGVCQLKFSCVKCSQFFAIIPSFNILMYSRCVLQPWVSLTETDDAQMAASVVVCSLPLFIPLTFSLFVFCHMFTLNFLNFLAVPLLVSIDQVIFNKCIFSHGPTYKNKSVSHI